MLKALIKNNISKESWSKLQSLKRSVVTSLMDSPYPLKLKHTRKIFIMGAADYENLGDHAIAYAQNKFLLKSLVHENLQHKYMVIEVPSKTPIRFVKRIVSKEDVFLYTGGGNLGTTYGFLDDIFLPIIKAFPENKHLFFPQSFTFNADDSDSRRAKIKDIFDAAGKNLTITARESKSKQLFEDYFDKNNIIYTPDIVLTLNLFDNYQSTDRSGIAMLMRGSGEKILSDSIQNDIHTALAKIHNVDFEVANTALEAVSPNDRDQVLSALFDSVASHKLIITDRLHGMIFAKITGTPCIAFDNHNSKIKMSYMDWLQSAPIQFIDPREDFTVADIEAVAERLMQTPVTKLDLTKQYQPLDQALLDILV